MAGKAGGADVQRLHGMPGERRALMGRRPSSAGAGIIENLGNLPRKRFDNDKISKKYSIICDYLRNIQYLCSVNARNNTRTKYDCNNIG